MSIRKRVLPSGRACWQFNYRDGQNVRRARQFETKKQATDFETQTRGEVMAGTHVADSVSATVADAAALWLDRCRLDELEFATVKQYGEHVRLHIAPLIGMTKLSRLTRPMVEKFRDKLLETHSRAMARKVLISLKSLLADAQRRGLVGLNAAVGTKIKMSGRHEEKVEIPTKAEIRILLAKALEMPVQEVGRALAITALFTGLRASELRGLTWDHVDFEKRVVEVEQRADFRGTLGSRR